MRIWIIDRLAREDELPPEVKALLEEGRRHTEEMIAEIRESRIQLACSLCFGRDDRPKGFTDAELLEMLDSCGEAEGGSPAGDVPMERAGGWND